MNPAKGNRKLSPTSPNAGKSPGKKTSSPILLPPGSPQSPRSPKGSPTKKNTFAFPTVPKKSPTPPKTLAPPIVKSKGPGSPKSKPPVLSFTPVEQLPPPKVVSSPKKVSSKPSFPKFTPLNELPPPNVVSAAKKPKPKPPPLKLPSSPSTKSLTTATKPKSPQQTLSAFDIPPTALPPGPKNPKSPKKPRPPPLSLHPSIVAPVHSPNPNSKRSPRISRQSPTGSPSEDHQFSPLTPEFTPKLSSPNPWNGANGYGGSASPASPSAFPFPSSSVDMVDTGHPTKLPSATSKEKQKPELKRKEVGEAEQRQKAEKAKAEWMEKFKAATDQHVRDLVQKRIQARGQNPKDKDDSKENAMLRKATETVDVLKGYGSKAGEKVQKLGNKISEKIEELEADRAVKRDANEAKKAAKKQAKEEYRIRKMQERQARLQKTKAIYDHQAAQAEQFAETGDLTNEAEWQAFFMQQMHAFQNAAPVEVADIFMDSEDEECNASQYNPEPADASNDDEMAANEPNVEKGCCSFAGYCGESAGKPLFECCGKNVRCTQSHVLIVVLSWLLYTSILIWEFANLNLDGKANTYKGIFFYHILLVLYFPLIDIFFMCRIGRKKKKCLLVYAASHVLVVGINIMLLSVVSSKSPPGTITPLLYLFFLIQIFFSTTIAAFTVYIWKKKFLHVDKA